MGYSVWGITPPKDPNQLPVDFWLAKYYGDQVEVEHNHKVFGQTGKVGKVRALAYRNRENIGRFKDAITAFEADSQKNATSCPGFKEQYVAKDVGVFARGMISDGRSEVDAYTSADRAATFGTLAKGSLWRRPRDVAGLGLNVDWISATHAQYLKMGGIDGFVGDGMITPAGETNLDLFYSLNVHKVCWLLGCQVTINTFFCNSHSAGILICVGEQLY